MKNILSVERAEYNLKQFQKEKKDPLKFLLSYVFMFPIMLTLGSVATAGLVSFFTLFFTKSNEVIISNAIYGAMVFPSLHVFTGIVKCFSLIKKQNKIKEDLICGLDAARKHQLECDHRNAQRLKERKAKLLEEEEQARQNKIEQERQRQISLLNTIRQCNQDTELLESLLTSISSDIDFSNSRAKKDFENTLYGPFWDKVEESINHVGRYYESIKKIGELASRYNNAKNEIEENSIDKFNLSTDINEYLKRIKIKELELAEIVKPAQSNIDFASIYEMRKTNRVLNIGFNSLSSAIGNLGFLFEDKMKDISYQIQLATNNISDAIHQSQVRQEDALKRASETMEEAAKSTSRDLGFISSDLHDIERKIR